MGAFPVLADHWHVGTSRQGRLQVSPERLDRVTAVATVRGLLAGIVNATGDRLFAEALGALDRGCDSYRIPGFFYVVVACACPPVPLPIQEIKRNEESAQLWSR